MNRILTLSAILLLVVSCAPKSKTNGAPGNFSHTVYFVLANPDSDEDRKAFEASLTKFLDASEFIVTKHIGTPAATAHREVVDGSYTYSLLLTFKNKADQDAYQEEAVHKTFIEESAHLWTKVLVYDSENILK